MASPLLVALVAAVAVLGGGVGAQCPAAADLRPSNGTRVCAQLYTDDSPYYDQCCSGDVLVVPPDSDVPFMPHGWSGTASSLVVGTRCELTVWSRSAKRGNSKRFSAGAVPRLQEVHRGLFHNWNDAIKGYYCTCK